MMRKRFFNLLFVAVGMIVPYFAQASEGCFIAKYGNKILRQEGDCTTAYAPQSTFKIVLSLIGFDSGILESTTLPSWSMPPGTEPYLNIHRGDHNPQTWMRDSCVWYSNILTARLGMKKLQGYVNKFSYGNMDLSGGLVSSWITSSLQISPQQYIDFLGKLIERKFPISQKSYRETKAIMYVQELPGRWKLYGKTGNGAKLDSMGRKTDMQQGWFVGYMEKGKKKVLFVSHLVDNEAQDTIAAMRARNEVLLKLLPIINELGQ